MKNSKIRILMSFLLTTLITSVNAQLFKGFENPQAGNIPSLEINVTYDKTTHLIFPSAIRYVDLGSKNLVAGKADDADNVLRIKANQRDFYGQTNFSVITDDGKFYGFDVRYLPDPDVLSIDVANLIKHYQRRDGTDVLFEELGGNAPWLIGLIMETIYQKDKTAIPSITPLIYYVIERIIQNRIDGTAYEILNSEEQKETLFNELKKEISEHVMIYQSLFFKDKFPEDNEKFENIVFTDNKGDIHSSIQFMRQEMLHNNEFAAAVFIGGMDGIEVEYKMFKEKHPKALVIPMASTGAATKIVYDDLSNDDEEKNERFLKDYGYMSLFQKYLMDKI